MTAFKKKRAQCLRLSRQLYSNYVENTKVSLKKNIEYFWSFIKNTREDTSLRSTMYLNDEEATDGGKISRFFSTPFQSFYCHTHCPLIPRISSPWVLENYTVTPALLAAFISKLREITHSGPDVIPSILLKNVIISSRGPCCCF